MTAVTVCDGLVAAGLHVQTRQARHQVADGLQMGQQIVQFDDQRQEVVARQVRFLPQRLQVIFEGMRAAFDRGQPQGRRLALDRMHLPEQGVELLAEHALFARRLAQHRVDHLHGRIGIVQERRQLRRIDVQNAQQRIDLRLRLSLRGLQFAREIHAGADIRHRHQHVRHLAVDAHAVEFELQIARVESCRCRVEVHLHLAQRIDGLDQILVGALRPQDLDELQCGRQGLLGHDGLEQVLEGQAREVLALEQRFECAGIGRADDQILIEQEQAVLDGAQNVRGLLARLAQAAFLPLPRAEQHRHQHHEQQRDDAGPTA